MSIVLTANITTAGNFPAVTTEVISGGYQTVATLVDRDAITTVGVDSAIALDGYRRNGMLVYVQATGDTYILNTPLTNADWVLVDPITAADYTAKGVILVGTGVGTEAALPVGANGLVLSADSAEATGVKWVAGGGGGGIPVPAVVVANLYVSGLNGNDLNNGSTPLLAVATLARAWELIPRTLAAPFVVHLGAAGAPGVPYAWSPMPAPAQLTPDARIWLYGDGAGQVGEDGFEVVVGAPVVAIAGTDENQITTAAIVADAYQGFTLEVVDGPAAGYRRTILTNTTSSIVPCRRFETEDTTTAVTPVAGNTIRILRPTVIFSGYDTAGNTDGIPGLFSGIGNGDGGAPLLLVNLAFASVVNQTEINRCTIFGAGIEFRGTVAPFFTNCNGSFGNWDNVFDTAAAQGALPQGTNLSLAKTNWFTDIALALSPSPLATWRGWGVSQPDVVAVSAATTGLRFLTCQMSMFATVGDIHGSSCNLSIGGRFFGNVTLERGFYHLLGRSSGVNDSILFRRQIRTELCTVLSEANAGAFDFTYSATVDHQWSSISCDVQLLNNGTFVSATSGVTFLKMTGGGTFELGVAATWTFTYALDSATSRGLIQVADGTLTTPLSLTATNTLTGAITAGATLLAELSGVIEIRGTSCSIVGNVGATVGNQGVLIRNGGLLQTVSTLVTLTNAQIDVDGGSFVAAGAVTVTNATTKPAITLANRGSFQQTSGALTCAGFITSSASEWLSSGGSVAVSATNPLRLNDGSQFVATAAAGAWSLLSNVAGAAVTAIDSDLIVNSSSLTLTSLSAATNAIIATNSQIQLTPTTLAFTLGGIFLDGRSHMVVGSDLVITGAFTLADGSFFLSRLIFSVTQGVLITASECVHLHADVAPYFYADTMNVQGSQVYFIGPPEFTSAPAIISSKVTFQNGVSFPAGSTLSYSEIILETSLLYTAGPTLAQECVIRGSGIESTDSFSFEKCIVTVFEIDCEVLTLINSTFRSTTDIELATANIREGSVLHVEGSITVTGSVEIAESSRVYASTFFGANDLSIATSFFQCDSDTVIVTTISMTASQAIFGDLLTCPFFIADRNTKVRSAAFTMTNASILGGSSWWTTTGANIIASLTIDNGSMVQFGSAVAATGGLTLANGSQLTTLGAFSVAGAAAITDSECLHLLTAAYNSITSNILTRSKLSSAGALTFGASPLTLTQSEVTAAVASTFNGAVSATNSMINCAGTCTALSTVDAENSTLDIDGGNLAVTGAFTPTRCDMNVNGNFNANSATLVDTNLSVSGTYDTTLATLIQRESTLVVSGIVTIGDALTITQSAIVLQGISSCFSTLTLTNSRMNCSANFNALGTVVGENSTWDIDGGNLAVSSTFTTARCGINIDGNFSAVTAALTDTDMSVVGTYTDAANTLVQRDSSLVVSGVFSAVDFTVLQSKVTLNGVATCTDAVTVTNSQINCTANFSTTTTAVVNTENSTWDTDGANISFAGQLLSLRCNFNVNGTFTGATVTLTDSDMSVTSTYLDNNATALSRSSKLVVTGSMTADNVSITESSELLAENALSTGDLTIADSKVQADVATMTGTVDCADSGVSFAGRLECNVLNIVNTKLTTVDFEVTTIANIFRRSTWVAKGSVASAINTAGGNTAFEIDNSDVDFTLQTGLVTIISDNAVGSRGIGVFGACSLLWSNTDMTVTAGTAEIGIENRGGQLICTGVPTNINGTLNDFGDDEGPFSSAIVLVGLTVFAGQHPGGVYTLLAPIAQSSIEAT